MTQLVRVADAGYPFDLSKLPADVHAVAGYVYGDTPHIWSLTEVQAVRATGREWWPIYTAPSTGQILSAVGGSAAGQIMCRKLVPYGVDSNTPVFLDIENGTWNASPSGAMAYLNSWKSVMSLNGYQNHYGYVPWSAQTDWVANWTGQSPSALPPNVFGWQYISDKMLGLPFDLSIFDLDMLRGGDNMAGGLTDAQAKSLAHIELLAQGMNAMLVNDSPAIAEMRGEEQALYNAIAVQAAREAGLLAAIQQLGAGNGSVDLHAIEAAAQEGATAALSAYQLTITKAP